jgi:hypothetical protein
MRQMLWASSHPYLAGQLAASNSWSESLVNDLEADAEDELWCSALRRQVKDYMARTGVHHGEIGEVPAWAVFPHISIWAVESGKASGKVGWWVICGDCPTDYITCTGDRTPRAAVEAFAERWGKAAAAMMNGEQHPDFVVGNPGDARELAPMLAARAEVLRLAALDDSDWDD